MMRVLLFDDNGLVRSATKTILAQHGWEVLSFPDPVSCPLYYLTDCVCHLPEVCADVLITDFDMPQADGLEFVKLLLKKGCGIKNLALFSGTINPEVLTEARSLGLAVFDKSKGFSPLVAWLRGIETNIREERVLTQWCAL